MIIDGPRQSGRTTAIVEAAKKIGAVVVCFSARHAQQVHREHGVTVVPMCSLDRMAGMKTPVLWDHAAVERLQRENQRLSMIAAEIQDVREWKRNADRQMRQTLHGLRDTHRLELAAKDQVIRELANLLKEDARENQSSE